MKNKRIKVVATIIIAVVLISVCYYFFVSNRCNTGLVTAMYIPDLTIHITDNSGNYLSGVVITDKDINVKFREENIPGIYSLDNSKKRIYNFVVKKSGYENYDGSVKLEKNGCGKIPQTLNIILKKE